MMNLFSLSKYSLKSLSYEEESKEYAAQKIERGEKRWFGQLTNKTVCYFSGLFNGCAITFMIDGDFFSPK